MGIAFPRPGDDLLRIEQGDTSAGQDPCPAPRLSLKCVCALHQRGRHIIPSPSFCGTIYRSELLKKLGKEVGRFGEGGSSGIETLELSDKQLLFFWLFWFAFFFLRPHLQHMEVPRLGVESELQLQVHTAAHSNAGSKRHLQPMPQLEAMPDP